MLAAKEGAGGRFETVPIHPRHRGDRPAHAVDQIEIGRQGPLNAQRQRAQFGEQAALQFTAVALVEFGDEQLLSDADGEEECDPCRD